MLAFHSSNPERFFAGFLLSKGTIDQGHVLGFFSFEASEHLLRRSAIDASASELLDVCPSRGEPIFNVVAVLLSATKVDPIAP
jgi:hypothetical protein